MNFIAASSQSLLPSWHLAFPFSAAGVPSRLPRPPATVVLAARRHGDPRYSSCSPQNDSFGLREVGTMKVWRWFAGTFCVAVIGCGNGTPAGTRLAADGPPGPTGGAAGSSGQVRQVPDAAGSPRLCSDLVRSNHCGRVFIRDLLRQLDKAGCRFPRPQGRARGDTTDDLLPDRLPLRVRNGIKRRRALARQVVVGEHGDVRHEPQDAVRHLL